MFNIMWQDMLQLNLIKGFQKPNKVSKFEAFNKFIIPKLLLTTQSEVVINKKARPSVF